MRPPVSDLPRCATRARCSGSLRSASQFTPQHCCAITKCSKTDRSRGKLKLKGNRRRIEADGCARAARGYRGLGAAGTRGRDTRFTQEDIFPRASAQLWRLSGGVFANVKLTQRIAAEIPFDEVFVCPAMSDQGEAAGGVLQFLLERDGLEAWLPKAGKIWQSLFWPRLYARR